MRNWENSATTTLLRTNPVKTNFTISMGIGTLKTTGIIKEENARNRRNMIETFS
jgi:hypothetical protein